MYLIFKNIYMSATITEELLKSFQEEKEKIINSDDFIKFLWKFKRKEYSIINKALIFKQFPTATETYWFWTWKKMGKKINKWAKGIIIYAVNEVEKENKDTKELEKKKYVWVKTVFDVSQVS